MVQPWFGCGADVGRRWLGRVLRPGADSLAEVEGKQTVWQKLRESGFLQMHPLLLNIGAFGGHRTADFSQQTEELDGIAEHHQR